MRWIILGLLTCWLVIYSTPSQTLSPSQFEPLDHSNSLPVLQQKLQQYERQNDRVNQGIALVNLAITYRQQGAWNLAEKSAEQSLTLLTGQLRAHALNIRAKLHLERGNPQAAYERWTEAATIYQQQQDRDSWYRVQADRSLALQNLGLYPQSCALLWETLDLPGKCQYSAQILSVLEQQHIPPSALSLLAHLGRVLQVLGELEGSEAILKLGIKTATNLGSPPETNYLWLNLGNTLRAKGADHYPAALTAYQRSGLLEGQVNQISLFIQTNELEKAKNLWQAISYRVIDSSITSKINFARSGIQLAVKYQELIPELQRLLTVTLQEAKTLNHPRFIAHTLLLQANLAEQNQDWQQAKTLNELALKTITAPDVTYLLFAQRGRIAQKTGHIEQAIAEYSAAIQALSQLRQDLVNLNTDVQYNFREGVEPIYRELVSLLLKNDRPSQAQLRQAREVMESLQIAELDNFFRDACADTKPTNIDAIDSKAAIFYPIVLPDRLEIIVAIAKQPLFHTRISIPRSTLRQTIQAARNSLRLTALPEERIAPTSKLYDWLIRPTETLLQQYQIETLVFVPDDSLRNLPFSILWDGSQYLLQKYNLALVPSLQLLSPQPIGQQKLQVTAAGLTAARQGFPPLPAVGEEIQNIAQILPTNIILNQEFTTGALGAKIATNATPIVHLATHGQFSSDINSTFLLTWDDRIQVSELGSILGSRPDSPIELLVLSACETAAGDDRANLGIAGFAIRSGARSTIASLWAAFDDSTAILMANFYQELAKRGTSKAQALRNAQIKLLRHETFSHPYYWAPFLLLGNWQ
ncbi:MAG: CHAT domain-containing protein [Pseudanabaenaceae cyanobacterium]